MGRDLFVVLAAIAGADSKIDDDERAALERAARDQGLLPDDIAAMTEAAKAGIGALELSLADPDERAFVYAMAYWISRLDGEMSEAEDAALAALGKKLSLEDQPRMGLEAAVDEVAALPQGDRPQRFDIERLRDLLSTKRVTLV